MCGIFGLATNNKKSFSKNEFKNLVDNLFIFSATRGKEAAGIALQNNENIEVLKEAGSPSEFIKNDSYKKLLDKLFNKSSDDNLSLIGHSRLVTNGLTSQSYNNQPVIVPKIVGVHNGIITNDNELWEFNKDIEREYVVDTEIILKLLNKNIKYEKSLSSATAKCFLQLKGSASIGTLFEDYKCLLLATNTGGIFYILDKTQSIFIFASERFILQKLLNSRFFKKNKKEIEINQLKPNYGLIIDLLNINLNLFNFNQENNFLKKDNFVVNSFNTIRDHTISTKNIPRCKKCILPVTYPYMELDSNGVCRYCRRHKKFEVKGEEELLKEIEKYRRPNKRPDCIVALSGGRDSCYGLHYIKKVLGMNPIAFTYDWGTVTDLARRNAARICGELGVEHIIRTPNIAKKRKYIRKNINAWLKKPELGMIPLFMAGDKAFYHFARQLRKETDIKLVFFCTGNLMENCPFKFGLSGVRDGESDNILTRIKIKDKLKLLKYYAINFILNPSYINESLLDTALAYWHTFIEKDDFLYLYRYLEWNEAEIVGTIINKYGWETSPDTKTTWRIGDGTASFYNYIYQTMAGFTEDDDMLSNMVREKYISREQALIKSLEYSKPRTESIMEYAQMIGINLEETLNKINTAKKRY